ncbi:unnamed protein product, partial [Heterosigma akashiwo]
MGPILGPWSDYHRKAWSKKVYLSQAPKLMEPKQYHNVSTDGIKADKGSLAEAARRGPREYAAAFRGARRDLAKTQLLPSYGDGPGQFEVPAALRAVAVRAPGRESEAFRPAAGRGRRLLERLELGKPSAALRDLRGNLERAHGHW